MRNSYRRLVIELRNHNATSPSRILVKGKTVHNPLPAHPDVCPLDCKKDIEVQRTSFLTRHHADRGIGLFFCEGCPHLLFKASIVPTTSMKKASIEEGSRKASTNPTGSVASSVSIRGIAGFTRVDSKRTRVMKRSVSKRITIPKRWIRDTDLSMVNTHLIREDATGHSYILIELPSDSMRVSSCVGSDSHDKVLTEIARTRLLHGRHDLTCRNRKCGKLIEVGDSYHRAGYRGRKFYHSACWQNLFIEA